MLRSRTGFGAGFTGGSEAVGRFSRRGKGQRRGGIASAVALVLVIWATLWWYPFIPVASTSVSPKKAQLQSGTNTDDDSVVLHPIFSTVEALISGELKKAAQKRDRLSQIIMSEEYAQARPKQGILFIKTHKTGSSTFTALLHALGEAHGLVMPIQGKIHYDARYLAGRKEIVDLPNTAGGVGPPFELWPNHVLYDPSLLDMVPSAAGKVVSIVRDPAERLRSMCLWSDCCNASYKDHNVWDNFVLSEEGMTKLRGDRWFCRLDGSSHELVHGKEKEEKEQNWNDLLHKIQSGEWLMLVTERFDESMLLFANEYDLHILDAVYKPLKVRQGLPTEAKEKAERTLQAEHAIRLESPRDMKLHEVANSMIDAKFTAFIASGNSTINSTLDSFNKLNVAVAEACAAAKGPKYADLKEWCARKTVDNQDWAKKHRAKLGLEWNPK